MRRSSSSPNRHGPLPPVLRSIADLESEGRVSSPPGALAPVTLPIDKDGTTFSMAQETRWLGNDHFAVGRWDGTLDVFRFNPAKTSGPLVSTAVCSPSSEGVQMITPLSSDAFASSNDASSMIIWLGPDDGSWRELRQADKLSYDPAFGVANSGDSFVLGPVRYLVAGHSEAT